MSTPPSSSPPSFKSCPLKATAKDQTPAPPRPPLPLSPALTSSPGDDALSEPQRVSVPGLIRILKHIKGRGSWKHPSPEWARYRVSVAEYYELLRRIDEDNSVKDWFEDKVRYDYSSIDEEFVLRMGNTALHECLGYNVFQRINAKLDLLKAEHPAELGTILAGVLFGANISIPLKPSVDSDSDSSLDELNPEADPFTSRQPPKQESSHHKCPDSRTPDGLFKYEAAQYPSMVFEVSYSQKREHLPQIADDYFSGTRGSIRAVVNLDVDYTPPQKGRVGNPPAKKASVSVWRLKEFPEYRETTLEQEHVYRTKSGSLRPGILSLPLTDFVPQKVLKTFPEATRILAANTTVDLSHAELYEDLNKALEWHEQTILDNGIKEDEGKPIRKRKRDSEEREERKAARIDNADKTFNGTP